MVFVSGTTGVAAVAAGLLDAADAGEWDCPAVAPTSGMVNGLTEPDWDPSGTATATETVARRAARATAKDLLMGSTGNGATKNPLARGLEQAGGTLRLITRRGRPQPVKSIFSVLLGRQTVSGRPSVTAGGRASRSVGELREVTFADRVESSVEFRLL